MNILSSKKMLYQIKYHPEQIYFIKSNFLDIIEMLSSSLMFCTLFFQIKTFPVFLFSLLLALTTFQGIV